MNPRTQNQPDLHIKARSVGAQAKQVLAQNGGAAVLGTTSRGIFIRTNSNRVLFISMEPFRGPLTITLPEGSLPLAQISNGMDVRIVRDGLEIPPIGLRIEVSERDVYRSSPPNRDALPPAERQRRIRKLVEGIDLRRPGFGVGNLRSLGAQMPGADTTRMMDADEIRLDMNRFSRYVNTRDIRGLVAGCETLIGWGEGLTPAGDDFILGLLLALNRWRAALWPGEGLDWVNRQVSSTAFRRTTTLSANLIEAATAGQADERLIAALDWLMGALVGDPGVIAGRLARWGNSSGVYVFLGMVAASTNGRLEGG